MGNRTEPRQAWAGLWWFRIWFSENIVFDTCEACIIHSLLWVLLCVCERSFSVSVSILLKIHGYSHCNSTFGLWIVYWVWLSCSSRAIPLHDDFWTVWRRRAINHDTNCVLHHTNTYWYTHKCTHSLMIVDPPQNYPPFFDGLHFNYTLFSITFHMHFVLTLKFIVCWFLQSVSVDFPQHFTSTRHAHIHTYIRCFSPSLSVFEHKGERL